MPVKGSLMIKFVSNIKLKHEQENKYAIIRLPKMNPRMLYLHQENPRGDRGIDIASF